MKAIDISEPIFWTHEQVAAIGQKVYDDRIKSLVEISENIGKMLTLDVETGEYSIDLDPAQTILNLKQKRPLSRLFTLRIGHQTGFSFGGADERVER